MIDIPENVKMIPVISSSFSAMGFDEAKNELYIRFNRGALYIYQNVTPEIFKGLTDSNKKGVYLKEAVINHKEKYPFRKA